MEKIQVGDLCKIVAISKVDGLFPVRKNLIGAKVKVNSTERVNRKGFGGHGVILQENTGKFRAGETIDFYGVKLKKIIK